MLRCTRSHGIKFRSRNTDAQNNSAHTVEFVYQVSGRQNNIFNLFTFDMSMFLDHNAVTEVHSTW